MNYSIYTYIFVISIMCILFFLYNKHKSKYLICLFGAIYVIFASFRTIDEGVGGIDAYVYLNRFLNCDPTTFLSIFNQGNEFGYGLIIFLFRIFTDNYIFVQIFVHTLIIFCLIQFQHKSKQIYSIFVLINCLLLVISSFNIQRTIMSISITLLVFNYLVQKKYGLAIIFTLIATSFHIFAIIMIPIIIVYYFFCTAKNKVIFIWGFIIALSLIFIPTVNVVKYLITGTKYEIYLIPGDIALSTYISYLFILVICSFNIKKLLYQSRYNAIFIICISTGVTLIFLQAELAIFYRFLLLFQIPMFCLLGNILRIYKNNKQNLFETLFVKSCIIFILVLKIYVYLTVGALADGLY